MTERVIDTLGEAGIRATFFVQGRWVEAYGDVAARIAPAGHLVGNHSHYHARMPLLSRAGFATDVRAAEKVISEALGVDPRPWFRLPFGAGARRPALHRRLEAIGYRDVGWDVDARDWFNTSPGRLVSSVTKRTIARGDGAVLLFHGWPRITPLALPDLIARLRDAGAEFVRIDELPEIPRLTRQAAATEAALDSAGLAAAGDVRAARP